MKDGGVVSKEELKSVEGTDGTKVSLVKSPNENVQWEKIVLAPFTAPVDKVEYTPVSQTGEKGETKSQVVTDGKNPTEIVFDKPISAVSFIVKAVSATPDSKPKAEVVSAVACYHAEGISQLILSLEISYLS